MNILYYTWNENPCKDMVDTLLSMGHKVKLIDFPLNDCFENEAFETLLSEEIQADNYDFIFTFDYFPIISKLAECFSIKYVCWVFDCPHLPLYATNITNSCNYLFLFDRNMVGDVIYRGAKHAYHLPLAANVKRLNQKLGLSPEASCFDASYSNYQHGISFVGSLYENNMYHHINFLPEELRGYLMGIMESQKRIWGMDLISQLMTDDVSGELSKYLLLEQDSRYTYTSNVIFSHMLQTKITSDERITALNLLAEHFPVSLYSASSSELCPQINAKGTVSYLDAMPSVFRDSKINLNITLRSITSGIPLRAVDILCCGGFLLTNYQQELCEYLEAGKDFVYFEDFEHMVQLADYYLKHDDERILIARNGYQKANKLFSFEKQVLTMLEKII